MQNQNKYGTFDLGFGLHISLDPNNHQATIPNLFVTQTSLGKLVPPNDNDTYWDLKWAYICKLGHQLVDQLNSGKITEDFVKSEINRINDDTLKNTLTI